MNPVVKAFKSGIIWLARIDAGTFVIEAAGRTRKAAIAKALEDHAFFTAR